MAINDRYVGQYNVVIAQSLLGPANFGDAAPKGCFSHLVLIVQQLAIGILRIYNYLCGDRHWYDNETARQIILQHIASGSPASDSLSQRVLQLYDDLAIRADGDASYVDHIPRTSLPCEQLIPVLPLVREQGAGSPVVDEESSSRLLHQLPPEISIEVFKKLDPESLLKALSVNVETCHFIKSEDKLSTDLLLELALKKMFSLIKKIENTLYRVDGHYVDQNQFYKDCALEEIALAQAAIEPERALAVVDLIQNPTCKHTAIKKIIDALASINPSRAIQLLQFFEINNTHFKLQKDRMLVKIAMEQAATDSNQALAAVDLIKSHWHKIFALIEVGKREAIRSPENAATIFLNAVEIVQPRATSTSFGNPSAVDYERAYIEFNRPNRYHQLVDIASAWSLSDPQRASQFCQEALAMVSQKTGELKFGVVRGISKVQALISPQQARESANILHDRDGKQKLLYEIAQIQASANTEEAMITANLITEPVWKANALCAIAKGIGAANVAQTHQLLEEAAFIVQQMTGGLREEPYRAKIIARIAAVRAIAEPENPLAITALGYDESASKELNDARAYYFCEIAECLALHNLEQTLETARRIPDQKIKEQVLRKIARVQAISNVEEALETAGMIEDRLVYVDALCGVAKVCAQADKMRANEIFADALGKASELDPRHDHYLSQEHFKMYRKVVLEIAGKSTFGAPIIDDFDPDRIFVPDYP